MTFSLLRTWCHPLAVLFCVAGVTDRRCDAGDGLLVASGRRIAAGLLHVGYPLAQRAGRSLMVRRCIDALRTMPYSPVAR